MLNRSAPTAQCRGTMTRGLALMLACSLAAPLVASAQERFRDSYRDSYRVRRLESGTTIQVRTNETIDARRAENRIYPAIVDQDVRGDNRRIVIPRGANVELTVRVARDNDLVLDLESVVVNGERYAIRTDRNRVESRSDNSIVGSIVGALGGEVRGRAVRVPRDSVITFRLERPLEIGMPDRSRDRDERHDLGDSRR
jgi:hypothetical protein